MEGNIRKATHAGTWYSASKSTLMNELKEYLSKIKIFETKKLLKGVIVPHAGFRYSGPTAAWSYGNINPSLYNRVVLLGPSHKAYFPGCGLTPFNSYDTPFGEIKIDVETNLRLSKVKNFEILDKDIDENEHSLEMQLPYLKLIFGDKDFTLLPIMVGSTNADLEKYFGTIFSELYKDEKTLFVISSDFCHWGSRFNFTYHDNKNNYPYESIEELDKKGMDIIEILDAGEFNNYINSYKNTICGRKPISVFLNTINACSFVDSSIKFIHYEQSEKVKDFKSSSVSYASALNFI